MENNDPPCTAESFTILAVQGRLLQNRFLDGRREGAANDLHQGAADAQWGVIKSHPS